MVNNEQDHDEKAAIRSISSHFSIGHHLGSIVLLCCVLVLALLRGNSKKKRIRYHSLPMRNRSFGDSHFDK